MEVKYLILRERELLPSVATLSDDGIVEGG